MKDGAPPPATSAYCEPDKCHHIVNVTKCQEIVNGPSALRASPQGR